MEVPPMSDTVLTFLGAARTVTGSKAVIDTDDARVMVDSGLFQGIKELRLRNWASLPIDAENLDAVILTHAHLDHCGYLPRLVVDGFRGPVFASPGTAALTRIVLPDSARLQEEEAAYANRKGYSKHQPALPLYEAADADAALRQLVTVPFGQHTQVATGVSMVQQPAGHILGSAVTKVTVGDVRITFSGDLGRSQHPLLVPPAPVGDADWIVVESTYGDRVHDDSHAVEQLRDTIARTIERGGTVVIPAFAVDRTEVLLHHLGHLDDLGQLPAVPVYVDSPMALDALRVYRQAISDGSPEIRPEVFRDPTPFLDHRITEVRDPAASRAVTQSPEPKIIISASGMASGGRVVHHLARYLPDRRSTVALVGFQAAGTRGRALVDGVEELKMLGRYVRVRAEVVSLPSFSVHADADDLMAWLRTATQAPRGVFCVHGEDRAAQALASRIRQELDWDAVAPRHQERVLL
jgi:metallo-beta-lactamase family protein